MLCWTVSCEEESFVRDYPEITGSSVTDITEDAVTFNATVGEMLRDSIVDHGFVWSQGRDLIVGAASTVRVDDPTSGSFSAHVDFDLAPGTEYYAKAFVITKEHVVYGLQMRFRTQNDN